GDGVRVGFTGADPAVSMLGGPPASVGRALAVEVKIGPGGAVGDSCTPGPPSALAAKMTMTTSASTAAPAIDQTFQPTPPACASSGAAGMAISGSGVSSRSS